MAVAVVLVVVVRRRVTLLATILTILEPCLVGERFKSEINLKSGHECY